LQASTLRDPIEQQLAPLLQILLLGLALAILLTAPVFLIVLGPISGGVIVGGQIIAAVFDLCALIVLWHGHFQRAVALAVAGLLFGLGLVLPLLGIRASTPFFIVFMLPLSLATLLAEPRIAGTVVIVSIAIVSGIALGEYLALPRIGRVRLPESLSIPTVATFIGLTAILGFVLARFGSSLRGALLASTVREQELATLTASLESAVLERTASLQTALQTVQQREARLSQALDELRASQQTIQELSAPIIPVLPSVLVAPLIGMLGNMRATLLTRNILQAVEIHHARYVIIDITGVPLVDTDVAGVVMNTAKAVGLLGAQVWLVGIRPEVAQTIVTLGIDLQALVTYPNLQAAVTSLLAKPPHQ